jgi:hypothetical protein
LQYLVRGLLGFYVWACFKVFREQVSRRYGQDVGLSLVLITACQFHLPFYMTRTLPNVFALGLVLLAYAALLKVRHAGFLPCRFFSRLLILTDATGSRGAYNLLPGSGDDYLPV